MLPDHKVKCPATGFARSCREIVAECECPKFVHVQFVDPQSAEKVDKYGCADAFMPILTVLNAQAVHQADGTMQAFRNDVAKASEAAVRERTETLERLVGTGVPRLANGGR